MVDGRVMGGWVSDCDGGWVGGCDGGWVGRVIVNGWVMDHGWVIVNGWVMDGWVIQEACTAPLL